MVVDMQRGIEVGENITLLVAGRVTGLEDQPRDVGQGEGQAGAILLTRNLR